MKDIIGWKEVAPIHQTISGISVKNGLVKSLLCSTEKGNLYSNKIEKSKITYYVGPNTQSAGIKALFRSFEKGNSFMVFEKLGVGRWRNLGKYKVKSHKKEQGGRIAFRLDLAKRR